MTEFNFKDLTPKKIEEYRNDIKTSVKKAIDNVVNLPQSRTFCNTIQPIIDVTTQNISKTNSFTFAKNFYTSKNMREAGTRAEKDVSKFIIDQCLRKDYYDAFADYVNNEYVKEKENLTYEENRYIEHQLRDFKRIGLHLDKDKREKISIYKKRLSVLCSEFSKNMNEENKSFEFTKEELDGMPESWFTDDKLNNGKYKMTLKYPDFIPAMRCVKNRNVRKQLYIGYWQRGAPENVKLFEEAIDLRQKLARILGYNNHADYVTEIKIVKSGKNALDFVENLNNLVTPIYDKDMNDLLEFAKSYQDNLFLDNELKFYDRWFYARAFKEQKCDLDLEKVREYFPINKVKDGMFNVYQKILGLVFTEIDTDNKWHKDVSLYSVTDNKTNELMGYFYLDMYPRQGKFSHAAAFNFIDGHLDNNNKRIPHVVAIACNFPKDDCISFDDVKTFFHEFGHVMHQICSRPQLTDFCGFNIEGDFIEAPSQMLEQFCYCKKVLQIMSSHKDTNEHIPEEYINKLKQMKTVLSGYNNKGQIMYALYDLRAHVNIYENFDSRKLWFDTTKDVLNYDLSDFDIDPVASFGHLMSGYDAGYYGYKRAETYSANMFYKMFKDDPLSLKNGMRYRKYILEPGTTKDGYTLLTDFLGEDPDDSYFLLDQGLN